MAYNRENFVKIKKEYETKKKNAIADAEQRTANIHLNYPDIKEIDDKLRMTGINIMQEAMKGREGLKERLEALQNENANLQEERKKLLLKHNLPSDATDIKYECKECNDTGYVGIDMCKCFKAKLAKEAFETSGLGALLKDQSFDSFDLSFYLDDKKNFEKIVMDKTGGMYYESFELEPLCRSGKP